MKKYKNVSNSISTIIEYARNNSKEYILVILIFIIGLFMGVMFINNSSEENERIIVNYIIDFTEKFKTIENIDKATLVTESIKSNILLALILWLAGTTIIGMPVVLGLILFRGFV